MTRSWRSGWGTRGPRCYPEGSGQAGQRDKNLTQFNNERCKALQPRHQPVLGAAQMESSFTEIDLGALTDIKLNMSQQGAFATKKTARVSWAEVGKVLPASQEKSVWPWWGHTGDTVSSPQLPMALIKQRTIRMVKGLEHLSYEKRPGEPGLFSPEKGSLRGSMYISMYVNSWREEAMRWSQQSPLTEQGAVGTNWNAWGSFWVDYFLKIWNCLFTEKLREKHLELLVFAANPPFYLNPCHSNYILLRTINKIQGPEILN